MGKRHHGKGEASGMSVSRGRNGAVSVDAADAAAAHGCGDAAAYADAARSGTGAAEASGSVSTADVPVQPSTAPFFSVVLSTYSSEPYLAAALGDLQDQLFTDWEAIVVNDCSPDGSLAIGQQFSAADARIRVVSHEVNRGLSAARNTGFAAARGRYVWFSRPRRSLRFHLSAERV